MRRQHAPGARFAPDGFDAEVERHGRANSTVAAAAAGARTLAQAVGTLRCSARNREVQPAKIQGIGCAAPLPNRSPIPIAPPTPDLPKAGRLDALGLASGRRHFPPSTRHPSHRWRGPGSRRIETTPILALKAQPGPVSAGTNNAPAGSWSIYP